MLIRHTFDETDAYIRRTEKPTLEEQTSIFKHKITSTT